MTAYIRSLVACSLALAALTGSGCRTAPAATEGEATLTPDQARRGEMLFRNYCSSCHQENGHGKPNVEAPAIAGLPDWYVEKQLHAFRKGWRGGEYEDVAGLRMRPMSLTLTGDEDIAIVARYVATLQAIQPEGTLDGDAAKGKAAYATCQACHGPDGEGMPAVKSPPLTQTHDWYLLTQLKNFKGGVRGDDQGDVTGSQMMPMANTLADEQAMKDVIAYVLTLRNK
jgi:cytochrome c553